MALLGRSNYLEEKQSCWRCSFCMGQGICPIWRGFFLPCDLYSHSSISVQYLIQHSGFCQCCTFPCKVPRYSQTVPVLLNEWAWTLPTHSSESFPGVLLACVSVWMRLGGGTRGTVLTGGNARLAQVWIPSWVCLGATGSYGRSDRPACATSPQDQQPARGPVLFSLVDVALKADHHCGVWHAMTL